VTDEPYVARGHGKERTFQHDLTDPDEVRRETLRLARELAGDLSAVDRPIERVIVKVRFAPFFTSTHGTPLEAPTLDPEAIERAALAALERFELDRPVRLLGVRAELARIEGPAEP